jgi:CBS domain containing-hemolysin-like protein
VAAEMALARVRRTRIEQMAERGNFFAKKSLPHLDDPERFISACQLGITIATLLLGAAGESALAEDMAGWCRSVGGQLAIPPHVISSLALGSYVLAFAITAFVQTICGELLPKMLTFSRAEKVLLWIIVPMHFWCLITSPFLKVLKGTTGFLLRMMGVKDVPSIEQAHTEEELRALVSASHDEGVLEPEEEEMLHSVFDFSDTIATEVMTPRIDMVCVRATSTVKEFVTEALKHGHSRLPVYEEDIDNVFGVMHIRDGLRAMVEHKENTQVREYVRKILIVPQNKNLKDLLTEFKITKTHMAVVMDEYGGTQGIVTLEDLLEELVGDIADEHEIAEEFVTPQEDGSFLIDAKLALEDFNERIGLVIEDEEFNTIGGHVFGQLGREPSPGDQIEADGYILRIEESDRHRIIKLRLILKTVVETAKDSRDTQSQTMGGNKDSRTQSMGGSKSMEASH